MLNLYFSITFLLTAGGIYVADGCHLPRYASCNIELQNANRILNGIRIFKNKFWMVSCEKNEFNIPNFMSSWLEVFHMFYSNNCRSDSWCCNVPVEIRNMNLNVDRQMDYIVQRHMTGWSIELEMTLGYNLFMLLQLFDVFIEAMIVLRLKGVIIFIVICNCVPQCHLHIKIM